MNDREFARTMLVAGSSAVVAAGVTACIFLFAARTMSENFWPYQPQIVSQLHRSFVASTDAESLVVRAVRDANPAVVAITISKSVPVYQQYLQQVPDPFGSFFGGGDYIDVPEVRQNGTEKKDIGGGSGFFVSADGYIVTNKHVVEEPDADYTVTTNDGKKYPAKVIARDPVLDLAVVKISGSGFPYLTFGDSDKLALGQSLVVIGNALAQFRNTVSVGVVSGLARSIVANDGQGGSESLDQLIQTDAAINPGNSGGPLLDLHGQVIGMAVATANDAVDISFAIPANSVKFVADSVRTTGKIVRPYLGVRYLSIDKELAQKNQLPFDHGVLVQRGDHPGDLAVIPGSPADKAGIVENDIILAVDGIPVDDDHPLAVMIRAKAVGATVELMISHRGVTKNVRVVLEEMK